MSSMGLTILVKVTQEHSERAAEAMEAGLHEAAQSEMKTISELYEEYCAASTDESPEQQQDDAEEKESTEEKGCVVDEPHAGNCVEP